MPQTNEPLASQIFISVGGSPLQSADFQKVAEITVSQHTHLPGMFTIRLYDSAMKYLEGTQFNLTSEIEIKVPSDKGDVVLIKGEITSVEPVFQEHEHVELIVRGYDKSHRLYRELKSKAFLNVKDSDIASQIASSAGLSAQAESTSTVYDHVYQHNESDLAFLMKRAWRIGYECFVDEGKLIFRKPVTSGGGTTLTWGKELISFFPRMTLAEQVDEVQVKGWDPAKKQAIVGQAQTGNLYPSIGDSKNGAAWAKKFGKGKFIVVDQPMVSQAEANTVAKARLDELSGAFILAEGVALRSPEIKAGKVIKLAGLGTRLSGNYLVTSANHVYTAQGFRTLFTVRGARTGLLTEQMTQQRPLTKWPGVVTAIVTNTNDPNKWGRVKVKFPWMTEDAESDWARVIGQGGGPQAGYFVVPQVNDEVIVAFEHGDFSRPFVLGGVWNGKDAVPPDPASVGAGEMPLVRTWTSPTGHRITTWDQPSKSLVHIITKEGHKILLDDTNKKIEITTQGGHKVIMDDNASKITIQSTGQMEVKSGSSMKIEAGATMDIKASGPITIKGATVSIN